MKLPNNLFDFQVIRKEEYLYIDKTKYIEELEKLGKYLFFIRPRRFGKSLFLSMLGHYYDLNHKEEFAQLFQDLYIGQHPTPSRNKYLLWKLNFSGLDTLNPERLQQTFEDRILNSLIEFFSSYAECFPTYDEIIEELKAVSQTRRLGILFNAVALSNYKIYLVIDEYDHFANDIIAMGNEDYYCGVVRASGFVRDFYETIKIGTQGVIDRIFMTGIAPIMLDDLTSGFNITFNITMHPNVNEMMGFTIAEVQRILGLVAEGTYDNIMRDLKIYYNGYLFNQRGSERVYNPDMVLYFLQEWQSRGSYPEQLIDDNVRTDYGRLNRLIGNEKNREKLEKIIREEEIYADLVSRFSFDRMYDEEYFVSLLFYMGLLTIRDTQYGTTRLAVPNYVIKTVFWEYIERKLKEEYQIDYEVVELRKMIWQMAYQGKEEPFLTFAREKVLRILSNRDLIQFDERAIKMILLTLLAPGKFYKVVSEREVEGGYVDVFLEKDLRFPDVAYEWIWELKYLKKSERGKLESVKAEGVAQLRRYGADMRLQGKENLKLALIVFVGKDDYVLEVL